MVHSLKNNALHFVWEGGGGRRSLYRIKYTAQSYVQWGVRNMGECTAGGRKVCLTVCSHNLLLRVT
jgi:hypothetical protein